MNLRRPFSERILKMARPFERLHGNDVKAQGKGGAIAAACQPVVGGIFDALARSPAHGLGRLHQLSAGFHLDNRDEIAPAGDDVDLARFGLVVAREDLVALEAERNRGKGFGKAPVALSALAVAAFAVVIIEVLFGRFHLPLSSASLRARL